VPHGSAGLFLEDRKEPAGQKGKHSRHDQAACEDDGREQEIGHQIAPLGPAKYGGQEQGDHPAGEKGAAAARCLACAAADWPGNGEHPFLDAVRGMRMSGIHGGPPSQLFRFNLCAQRFHAASRRAVCHGAAGQHQHACKGADDCEKPEKPHGHTIRNCSTYPTPVARIEPEAD